MTISRNYSPVYECIATSLDDALAIQASGGQRIELVSALGDGGITPSDGLIGSVLENVSLPVAVMLRPNKSSFFYSDNALEEMARDARRFEEIGVTHVVVGLLDPDGVADIKSLNQILAGTDFSVTFHRAIDHASNLDLSLQRINECQRITHILTSLGRGRVADNLDRLDWYQQRTRPRIILGSGITERNASPLAAKAKRFQTDLHVGTALRHGDPRMPVDPGLVKLMARALEIEYAG